MPVLDFNDPNPAFGGGGGAAEDIFELEMDTSMGSGMLTLDPAASYNVGDVLVISSSDAPGGGIVSLEAGDNIDGEMGYSLGASEVLTLRVADGTTFSVLGSSPSLSAVVFASGGDTVTLPSFATRPEGTCYLVVFNSGSGVVTVEPGGGDSITGGDQTIDTLYQGMVFRRDSSAWEPYTQTSGIAGGSTFVTADTWLDLPTEGAEGDSAYLIDAAILVRWSDDVDPLDAAGCQWVPDAIYSDATGTGVVAGVVDWLEPIDVAGVGDGQPVETWPSRAGTGDYTAAGTARPTFNAYGGADGGASVVFDGGTDRMAKSGGLGLLRNRSSLAILALTYPDGVGTTYTWWYASTGASTGSFRAALYGTGAAPTIYARPSDNLGVAAVTLPALTATTWGLLAGVGELTSGLAGRAARSAAEPDRRTALGVSANTADTDSLAAWIGAYDSGGGTPANLFAGHMGPLLVLADLTPGAARAVAAWLSSRAGLL